MSSPFFPFLCRNNVSLQNKLISWHCRTSLKITVAMSDSATQRHRVHMSLTCALHRCKSHGDNYYALTFDVRLNLDLILTMIKINQLIFFAASSTLQHRFPG